MCLCVTNLLNQPQVPTFVDLTWYPDASTTVSHSVVEPAVVSSLMETSQPSLVVLSLCVCVGVCVCDNEVSHALTALNSHATGDCDVVKG